MGACVCTELGGGESASALESKLKSVETLIEQELRDMRRREDELRYSIHSPSLRSVILTG